MFGKILTIFVVIGFNMPTKPTPKSSLPLERSLRTVPASPAKPKTKPGLFARLVDGIDAGLEILSKKIDEIEKETIPELRSQTDELVMAMKAAKKDAGEVFADVVTKHNTKKTHKECMHELNKLSARGLSGKKLLDYWGEEQEYRVLTEPAQWSGLAPHGSSREGLLGHHAMILLPDNRAIEYAIPDSGEKNLKNAGKLHISQEERRKATGATLEKMWQEGTRLKKKEFSSLTSYRPFKHDCFTFVDRVLVSSGEKPTTLRRAPKNEGQLREILDNLSNVSGTYKRIATLLAANPVEATRVENESDELAVTTSPTVSTSNGSSTLDQDNSVKQTSTGEPIPEPNSAFSTLGL